MRTRPGNRLEFPSCPFCGAVVMRPAEEIAGLDLPGGKCDCGAVYAMDPTGLRLGEALLEALSLACGCDSDLGWKLEPGEDYEERQILGYDPNRHVIIGAGANYRSGMSALCFIRLSEGALERAAGRARHG
ncbi:MAG: hypothetical protein V2A77_08570 [Pseudomonadota bacterium]